MARGSDGMHQWQRVLKMYLDDVGQDTKDIARATGVKETRVKTVILNHAAGNYVIPIVDGVENYAQAYPIDSVQPSQKPDAIAARTEKRKKKKLWEHEQERKAETETSEELFPRNELEDYLERLEDDADERNMQWYAAGALTGIFGTLVVVWLAGQIAG